MAKFVNAMRIGDLVRCRHDKSMYFVPLFFQTSMVMAQVRWWFKGKPHPRLTGHEILGKVPLATGKKYVTEFEIGPSMCATPGLAQGTDYVVCDPEHMLLFQ